MPGLRKVRRGRQSPSAFTLVELLVVVSIIALLIAILLPSLKRARENAKRIKCNTNLRSLAQAGLTYAADDKNEFAIPSGPGDQTSEAYPAYIGFGGKAGVGLHANNVGNSPFAGGPTYRLGPDDRPLNKVIYKGKISSVRTSGGVGRGSSIDYSPDTKLDLDLYHCPGDKGFPGMHHKGWWKSGLSGYDYYGTSYSSNPYLVGLGSANQPLDSNSIYLRPMSRVPNPTNTVLYSEYAMRFAVFADNKEEYNQPGSCWPYPGADRKVARGHHSQPWWFNVSFGDGHTDWVKIKGYGYLTGVKKAPSCGGPTGCPCLTQRGKGWQIDTMPAELIPTHKIRTGINDTLVAIMDGAASEIWDLQE